MGTESDSSADRKTFAENLTRYGEGDQNAAEELFPVLYDELRKIAASRMRRERAGHTLRPTALVHEAWARLIGQDDAMVRSKTHFIAIASMAMGRVLADHGRARGAVKRGGDRSREVLFDDQAMPKNEADPDVLAAIAESVERLAEVDERKAAVVQLRILGGLPIPLVAELLGVAPSTVSADWKAAKEWIAQELDLDLEDGEDD